jgi:hypothetical protein
VVIGNPPYQESAKGESTRDESFSTMALPSTVIDA